MNASICNGLVIDATQFFQDPAFQAWLNNGEPKFTWHQGGKPTDYSDVVVLVDPGLTGEGSDSDMPEHIWNQIVAACKEHFTPLLHESHIMVRLTNC